MYVWVGKLGYTNKKTELVLMVIYEAVGTLANI